MHQESTIRRSSSPNHHLSLRSSSSRSDLSHVLSLDLNHDHSLQSGLMYLSVHQRHDQLLRHSTFLQFHRRQIDHRSCHHRTSGLKETHTLSRLLTDTRLVNRTRSSLSPSASRKDIPLVTHPLSVKVQDTQLVTNPPSDKVTHQDNQPHSVTLKVSLASHQGLRCHTASQCLKDFSNPSVSTFNPWTMAITAK
jgi:hypothetical protein